MHDPRPPARPMIVEDGVVVSNRPAGTDDCYRMAVRSPRLAPGTRPGQFVMLRVLGRDFPFLGRPFSIADVDPAAPEVYEIAYTVVGQGTAAMAAAGPGDRVRSVGLLGNGFEVEPAPVHVFVAGGIGSAPFPILAREIARVDPPGRRVMYLGASRASGLHLAAALRALGVEVRTATLDGSEGLAGNVVELVEAAGLEPGSRVYACGPRPMFAALAASLGKTGHACQASLEEHMACGFGACNACVVPVRAPRDGRWRYELICLEGPVFDLQRIVWEPCNRSPASNQPTLCPR